MRRTKPHKENWAAQHATELMPKRSSTGCANVTAAKGTLGKDHNLTRQMQADWSEVLSETRQKEQDLNRQARSIWAEGSRLWQDVENRQDTANPPPPSSSPSELGPSM